MRSSNLVVKKLDLNYILKNREITGYQFLDDFKEFLRSQALHHEHSACDLRNGISIKNSFFKRGVNLPKFQNIDI